MNVIISPNIKKISERIDKNTGDTINPNTGAIVEQREVLNIPPKPLNETQDTSLDNLNPLQIQDKIKLLEEEINKLKDLRNKKIAEMQKQLEMLQNI